MTNERRSQDFAVASTGNTVYSQESLNMRYAHTFLFVCPDCNLPIAISKISDEKNLEQIDSARVRIKCSYCEHISEQLALTAKTHWVTDWADSTGSLSKETKAGQPNSDSNLRER